MAITKTTTVERCEVYPQADADAANTVNDGNPIVLVIYRDEIDDPDDSDLPIFASHVKYIYRYSDEANQTATDVSGEPQLVQDICGGIWS